MAATIAVKDIAVARKFYEDTLGLELSATEGWSECFDRLEEHLAGVDSTGPRSTYR